MSEENLSRKFEEYMIGVRQTGNTEATVDDFFDSINVPENHRNNFVLAAIMKDVDWGLIEQTPWK